MANISSAEDVNNTLKVQPSLVGMVTFLATLNIFLSIITTLANTLILIALRKVTSIYPPTKLLFRSLTISDLCVGLTAQPLFCVTLTGRITNVGNHLFYYSDRLNTTSSYVLFAVSVLTSTAISVDRLLALLLRLRYRQTVTLMRVRMIVIGIWFLCSAFGVWRHSRWGIEVSRLTFIVFLVLCLIISSLSYNKIYLLLRHHQVQVQDHFQLSNQPTIPLNVVRYKRTVYGIAWVQFTMLVCYLPFSFVFLPFTYGVLPESALGMAFLRFAITIVYLNSSLNPILYCWRIAEVKEAVKDTIRSLNCFNSS